jgi:hypothetical protein
MCTNLVRTNLPKPLFWCITKNLKLLFIWFHLHWFCFTKTYHLSTFYTTFSHNISCVKLKSHMHTCIHVYDCHMWSYVFIVCIIALFRLWRGAELPLWVMWVCWLLPRQVTHILSTYFYYCIRIFSSMHDGWNINYFTKWLDPSSV